jgi:fructose-bisphosphate aldolase class II
MRELLHHALAHRYAVGYFEAWDQYSLEAVLDAAEAMRAPVILGFGGMMMEPAWFGHRGLRGLAAMGRAMAESARVPVAYLLNEVESFAHIETGLAMGFNAVMLDTCKLSLEENITATCRVAAAAHAQDADVEGELDALPDASGVIGDPHSQARTDPARAARYVAETGIDALSVAIGNVHILTDGEATIDLTHLARLHEAVKVPFVVHGGTGFPPSAIPAAIELGVAKFNVGTVLKQRYLEGVRDALAALPGTPDIQAVVGSRKVTDVFACGKARMQADVEQRMALYGSAGKA